MIPPNTRTKLRRTDLIFNAVIPLLYLLVTLGIDAMIPYSTITPLMGICGLIVFAFRLPTRWMIRWSFVYAVVVAFLFLNPNVYGLFNGSRIPPDPFTPWFRSATFAIAASLSLSLNITLSKLRRAGNTYRAILSQLETPVLTSDINGEILYANEAALALLPVDPLSRNYLDLFVRPGHQGTLVASYLKCFEDPAAFAHSVLGLEIGGQPYLGKVILMEDSSPKVVVTILSPSTGGPPCKP